MSRKRAIYSALTASSERLYDGWDFAKLEEAVLMSKEEQVVTVRVPLPINVRARVIRKTEQGVINDPETVLLAVNYREKYLRRDTYMCPGDIMVSCSSAGKEVPVDYIDLPFNATEDGITEKSAVRIAPGYPASAFLTVHPCKLKAGDESLAEAIKAAVNAVRVAMMLPHFPDFASQFVH